MKSLIKDGTGAPVSRWIHAGLDYLLAALKSGPAAAEKRVVEDHVYVEELNKILRAHPGYSEGMRFALRDPGAVAASIADIMFIGSQGAGSPYRDVLAHVDARCELEPLPYP
jgi:hypothetical protein